MIFLKPSFKDYAGRIIEKYCSPINKLTPKRVSAVTKVNCPKLVILEKSEMLAPKKAPETISNLIFKIVAIAIKTRPKVEIVVNKLPHTNAINE